MKKPDLLITAALRDVVCSPEHDEQKIARYFARNYQQVVDGKLLDYDEFVEHLALLKALTHRIQITVLASACAGDTVFTHHRVEVEKKGGKRSVIEVLARFTLVSGQIARCEELTHLISGEEGDKDLGSRS